MCCCCCCCCQGGTTTRCWLSWNWVSFTLLLSISLASSFIVHFSWPGHFSSSCHFRQITHALADNCRTRQDVISFLSLSCVCSCVNAFVLTATIIVWISVVSTSSRLAVIHYSDHKIQSLQINVTRPCYDKFVLLSLLFFLLHIPMHLKSLLVAFVSL